MADNLNAPRPASASEAEPDSNHRSPSSTSATLISPTSSARPPVVRARPRLPAGPRTRKQTTLVPSKEDHSEDHTPPLQLPPAWTPTEHGSDVQLTNPFSPTPVPLLSTPQPVNSPPVPPVPHQPEAFSSPHNHQHLYDHDVTTSRPGTPTPIAALSPSPIATASRKPSHATVNSATAPPLTLPAAQLNLTPEPLPYKHLTLDAAHWTLTSTELQSLVSSAIRESAKEQFIRLLPQVVIDTSIPEDVARIERSWDTAAARWRFEAHRRNMLLRALAASGADSDLLSQLSGTLGTLDSHAQDLIHAATHRTQIAAARDTHRASALAVALRKLNASYARRTRDLDKARANISALRSEVEEAWKVAEEQAAEVDKIKSEATDAATQLRNINETTSSRVAELSTDDDNALEDDASSSAAQDGASVDLTTISRAQVVDVTGKAVAAQARLTMMRSNLSSPSPGRSPPGAGSSSSTPRSAVPPPSAFAVQREPSPATPASDNPPLPSSASQVSRVSAARRRSTRKSKASLRLPASIAVGGGGGGAVVRSRSRSVVRGEANAARKAARSKSPSRKGKERERAAPRPPWLSADVAGSFLEMEGRAAGEDDADADGEVDTDDGEGSTPLDSKPRTATTRVFSPPLLASGPASAPPAPAHMPQAPNGSSSPSTLGTSGQRESERGPSGPSSPSPIVPSMSSTPTFSPSEDSHHHHHHAYATATPADFIPDPASIFANATTTSLSTTIDTTISTVTTTTTTAASAQDIARRGHSLDLPSSTATSGKHHHRHATGAKIRRSISELLNFGSSGARARRRSLPFAFKGRSSTRAAPGTENGSGSGVGSSALRRNLDLNDAGVEGSEDGWEDTREDEGSTAAAAA
ncbi:hypothetical protein H4582DRAFT_1985493 [Lactarius indigo]|nr:hypothetical protein H4582DRAFT_1985493 [Lactarius indigo]